VKLKENQKIGAITGKIKEHHSQGPFYKGVEL